MQRAEGRGSSETMLLPRSVLCCMCFVACVVLHGDDVACVVLHGDDVAYAMSRALRVVCFVLVV
jgi:hypothetical protein